MVCLCVFFVDVIVCMLVFKMLILNPSNPISRIFVPKAILTMDEVNCNFWFFFSWQMFKVSVLNLKKKLISKGLSLNQPLRNMKYWSLIQKRFSQALRDRLVSNQHPLSVTLQKTAIWWTFYLKLDLEPLDDFLDSNIKILDKTNNFSY